MHNVMELLFRFRAIIISFLYRRLLRPVFFLIDPEKVHDLMLARGLRLGKSAFGRCATRLAFYYGHPSLEQTVKGVHFPNPVGLAAGFDKNGTLTQIIPEVGFGFTEIGSISARPCGGNSGQHLWRLKKSKSILVNYGLKNVGADVISESLSGCAFKIPIGISLAKTNSPATIDEEAGISDYVQAYSAFASRKVGDYFTINISCPNACGGQPFLEPQALKRLLAALTAARQTYADQRPWFLKLSADLYPTALDAIIEAARTYGVSGFICSNLTKNRNNKKIVDRDVPSQGGLSGAVVRKLSDNLIRHIYKKTGREFVIIGCGGIFSAEDAYEKIKAGASLLQLITGMIYEGPQLISEINQGLVDLLHRDGYNSISEAIGTEAKILEARSPLKQ